MGSSLYPKHLVGQMMMLVFSGFFLVTPILSNLPQTGRVCKDSSLHISWTTPDAEEVRYQNLPRDIKPTEASHVPSRSTPLSNVSCLVQLMDDSRKAGKPRILAPRTPFRIPSSSPHRHHVFRMVHCRENRTDGRVAPVLSPNVIRDIRFRVLWFW
ncbi:hypothetical protein B0H65DRAFT_481762 [Neurospora tetraspora]|uniref:Uncharacterized protein n=1 Tax=Neurospora tetraspora TaxID=94610 RepID=A0AAE0J0R1_9PEZI|nr:hypothetical protein B0H65DRAFT_481762 [Neurospora tetraspora]